MLFDTLRAFDRPDSAWWTAFDGRMPLATPMDLRRVGDRYVLEADLPGMDPESIEVTVDGRWLNIRAERSTSSESERGEWLVRERSSAQTMRQIALGQDIDADAIAANYRNGVLTVMIPIAESARPRKIAVESGAREQSAVGRGTTVTVQEKGREPSGVREHAGASAPGRQTSGS